MRMTTLTMGTMMAALNSAFNTLKNAGQQLQIRIYSGDLPTLPGANAASGLLFTGIYDGVPPFTYSNTTGLFKLNHSSTMFTASASGVANSFVVGWYDSGANIFSQYFDGTVSGPTGVGDLKLIDVNLVAGQPIYIGDIQFSLPYGWDANQLM